MVAVFSRQQLAPLIEVLYGYSIQKQIYQCSALSLAYTIGEDNALQNPTSNTCDRPPPIHIVEWPSCREPSGV